MLSLHDYARQPALVAASHQVLVECKRADSHASPMKHQLFLGLVIVEGAVASLSVSVLEAMRAKAITTVHALGF